MTVGLNNRNVTRNIKRNVRCNVMVKYERMKRYREKTQSIIKKLLEAMIENEIKVDFTPEEAVLVTRWVKRWILDNSSE